MKREAREVHRSREEEADRTCPTTDSEREENRIVLSTSWIVLFHEKNSGFVVWSGRSSRGLARDP